MEKLTWKIGLLFVLVKLIQGFEFQKDQGTASCTGRALDLAFAFDASDGVSAIRFQKQIDIMKDIVSRLDVGLKDDQVRVGVMSFGEKTRVQLHFFKSRDQEMVMSKIDRIKHLRGRPNLAKALKQMCHAMFRRRRGSRSGVKHMGIVLASGISQNDVVSPLAVQTCQNAGVEILTVGIDSKENGTRFWNIDSQPTDTHLLHLGTFDDLRRIQETVIQRICQEELTSDLKVENNAIKPRRHSLKKTRMDEKVCHNKVADIFFLMDSSSSIRTEDFKKQINVIKNIIRRFDISPTLTRVGISTFSHDYHNLLKFGDSHDKVEILRRLGTLKYLSGGTRTGHALHRLRTHVFDKQSSRPEADRIIVIFTDGQSGDYRRTIFEAKLLKKSGVKIFVVGIGSYVDREELEYLASEPIDDFLHTFDSFDTLLAKSSLLGTKTCEEINHLLINDQDVCNSSQPTDVMFMLNHNHLGQKKTNNLMKVVAEVVEIFGTDGPFRVGTMFDECLTNQDIPIGSVVNKTKLLNKIDDFQYGTPKSMIQQLRFDVFSHKKRLNRHRARRLGLLFLDRDIKLDDPSLRIESRRALNRGIQLYAIVIGKGVNLELVERSLAPRERIIFLPSYETLETSLPSILVNRLCIRRDNSLTYNTFSR